MGLQIAKLCGAALVIGSSRNAEHCPRLAQFGADLAVDTSDARWADQVLEATGGKGVDLVIDQVSGNIFNATQKATAITGRIVNVGRLGGMSGEFDFNVHALRRIQYIGVTFRTRRVQAIAERMRDDLGRPSRRASFACRSIGCSHLRRRRARRRTCLPTGTSGRSRCGYRSCNDLRTMRYRRLS